MFSCSCEIGGSIYRLSTTRSSFNGASKACRNRGGRLAAFLKESTFQELKNCCSQGGEYWIGFVGRNDCPPDLPYRRDTTTSQCRSAAPLTVAAQPNNRGCHGVVIATTDSQQNLPMARETECVQSQQFICQNLLLVLPTAFATKTSISSVTRRSASTASFTSTQLSSVTSTFPGSFHTSPNTIANSTQSETNTAIISSTILGSIILLLLLANFCCWRYKKSESAHTKTRSAASEQLIVQFKQTHTSKRNQEHLCQKYV